MSYILDALKKAESERHLGELPGLHTPSLATLAPVSPTVWWRRPAVILFLSMIACGAAAAVAWQLMRPADGGVRRATVVAALPAEAPTTAPAPVVVAEPVPALASDLPVPPPLPKPPAVSKPATVALPQTTSSSPAALPKAPVKAPSTVITATPPAATTPAADTARVLTLAQLPDALQHELPPLAIGGSMYSDSPADRMLLIDKRLFHEGDEVAPGLVLENLMPKSAILRFKGYRFRIGF
jgi:general secretion pathway protein B